MLEQFLAIGVIVVGSVVVALTVIQFIGCFLYDVREARLRRQQVLHPNARRYRSRPVLTVLILTHNDEQTIAACLKSAVGSNYKKLEIIIVDGASTDRTKQIARQFIKDYPNRSIRLVAQRTRIPAPEAAYKRYAKGELVIVLQPDMVTEPPAFSQAVMHLNRRPEAQGVQLAQVVRTQYQFTGLLQQYYGLVRQRALKARHGIKPFRKTDVRSAVWRREAVLGNTKAVAYYAADTAIQSLPYSIKRTVRQNPRLGLRHAAVIISMPTFLSYLLYLAVNLHQPALLIASLIVTGLWFGLAIWDSQHLKMRHKISYTLGVPLTYLPIYVLAVLRLFSIGRIRISADR
jgi:hypothetical protein